MPPPEPAAYLVDNQRERVVCTGPTGGGFNPQSRVAVLVDEVERGDADPAERVARLPQLAGEPGRGAGEREVRAGRGQQRLRRADRACRSGVVAAAGREPYREHVRCAAVPAHLPRERLREAGRDDADLVAGDDDTVSGVSESDHATEQAARAWVTRELPLTEFPDWVARRPHGTAGAFLYGSVTRGYLTADEPEPSWEPDVDAPTWDADLVNGTVRWHQGD